jgi:hypothetical protein
MQNAGLWLRRVKFKRDAYIAGYALIWECDEQERLQTDAGAIKLATW